MTIYYMAMMHSEYFEYYDFRFRHWSFDFIIILFIYF